MSTVERKVRKPGLYDSQVIKAKEGSIGRSYKKSKRAKAAMMNMAYGKRPQGDLEGALHVRMLVPSPGMGAHSFTEHGDFTSCFRRGI